MTETATKTITEEMVIKFSEISGDINPVHLDNEFAQNSPFKKKIAHCLISAGLFSAIFGTKLPGTGCVYVTQDLNFKRPVYIGDLVVAKVIVTKINTKTKRVFFDTECSVNKKIVINGNAELYIPEYD